MRLLKSGHLIFWLSTGDGTRFATIRPRRLIRTASPSSIQRRIFRRLCWTSRTVAFFMLYILTHIDAIGQRQNYWRAEDSFFICNFSAKRGEVTDITSKAVRRKLTADSARRCYVNLRTWNLRHSVLGARSGWPNFRDLLFRRRQCIFIAFDLLWLNGKDLRALPLLERKAMLKKLLRRKRSRILYLDHVEADGPLLLFEQVVKMDLEGIVCKRKDSPYRVTEKPSRYWIKVKNARYSQLEGREELFKRSQ